ncbi:MAG: glycosyltransferase [Myxococcota bacterium]
MDTEQLIERALLSEGETSGSTSSSPHGGELIRPRVAGKFLYAGNEKLFVRGVTYGTFRPRDDGSEYDPATTETDFAAMGAHGINAVRVYTVPPRWFLDTAHRHRLRVMVGLPWEQHVAFLEDRERARSIQQRVREAARACAGHPAILCYAVGNEIPTSVVRWHGARRVERFLERLHHAVKEEDPGALVTYVNYPSTEYLRLDFADFQAFNVYLESRARLERYLARLHNLAGDRPLLFAEVGLDSRRNGEDKQATTLDWQLRTIFSGGGAGAFVFSWTDEWHRGGLDIEDWDFGLTTRSRRPKPALSAVRRAYAAVPFPPEHRWPRVSVVVCSFNGGRTIRNCLEGLAQLQYPDYEVIVVDDGSTDDTAAIASGFNVRLIRTENRGLSNARNTGLEAATGEIVAYTDDDARPDPHWLMYLAATFQKTSHVGVGGPNIAPPGDGPIADCVANAPGGPVHVLLTDELAEHIPGCNMAFRRDALLAVGGFDPRYRAAGDDVDICWRLQERGWTLGFHAAAMVWHKRRNSLRAYWTQQQGYGKAEALLEEKWPERYNAAGHLSWAGRLYGKGLTAALQLGGGRVYQGTWGVALFQSIYQPAPGLLSSLPLMPEWWLMVAGLSGVSALGLVWPPLLFTLLVLGLAVAAPLGQAVVSSARASFTSEVHSWQQRFRLHAITAALHLLQPIARLRGRIRFGLTPWRRRGWRNTWPSRLSTTTVWSETWRAPEAWLGALEARLRKAGAVAWRGGDYDAWDLEVRGGILGGARLIMMLEEHGAGRQLARFRVVPRVTTCGVLLVTALLAFLVAAAVSHALVAAVVLGAAALVPTVRTVLEVAVAMRALHDATQDSPE